INIKYGIDNYESNNESRLITAEYDNYYIVCSYHPNAGAKLKSLDKKLEWNKIFKEYIKLLDAKKPVIICGDLNVAHKEIDLKNPTTNSRSPGFTKDERDNMTDLLAAGFIDTYRNLYPDKEGAYTFWNYVSNARSRNAGWRLDYFLTSKRIVDNVCDNVIRSEVYGSDHCPVVLYLNI
ncbi:LOW QUALITY PROTEIN: recombination repair protein 1-like, partial [Aphidius gifuensis]|uniref:LOW QUALITY PROTEIN: recombination repair protein 1-like n=1 Tax=Aphidius gifuensis TaxID=684658 RepID=UPI001CDB8D06